MMSWRPRRAPRVCVLLVALRVSPAIRQDLVLVHHATREFAESVIHGTAEDRS